jgi:hypothetical protein
MLGNENTVVWLTSQASVVRARGRGRLCPGYLHEQDYTFRVNVDGKGKEIHALARSSEEYSENLDVIRRLLLAEASEVYELEFRNEFQSGQVAFFNAPSFADLAEQFQSLKALTLKKIVMNEDFFRARGDFSRPGLKIKLENVKTQAPQPK